MNCVFKDITTIGDLRTEYGFFESNNNTDVKHKNEIFSTLDIIERYPSYQCASFCKLLNIIYPESQNCFWLQHFTYLVSPCDLPSAERLPLGNI